MFVLPSSLVDGRKASENSKDARSQSKVSDEIARRPYDFEESRVEWSSRSDSFLLPAKQKPANGKQDPEGNEQRGSNTKHT